MAFLGGLSDSLGFIYNILLIYSTSKVAQDSIWLIWYKQSKTVVLSYIYMLRGSQIHTRVPGRLGCSSWIPGWLGCLILIMGPGTVYQILRAPKARSEAPALEAWSLGVWDQS